jgi:hypothetical protein
MSRKYYSSRSKDYSMSLQDAKSLFNAIYTQLCEKDYFSEAFGFNCVDVGRVPGITGNDPGVHFLRHLRKAGLWPISETLQDYSENDLFDVIELCYDLVSKPVDGKMHSYNECGMHWDQFDRTAGKIEFRTEINEVLADYGDGFELSVAGEIVEKADLGLETLIDAGLPTSFDDRIRKKMSAAIRLFRSRNSTLSDRHSAVRMLADIFENLRPSLKLAISQKDESDLFNIANNFAIRHDNDKQKTTYDMTLWLSWMFYFYLATLHYSSRKLVRAAENDE